MQKEVETLKQQVKKQDELDKEEKLKKAKGEPPKKSIVSGLFGTKEKVQEPVV